MAIQGELTKPINFEIRQDSPSGPVVGQGTLNAGPGIQVPQMPLPMHMATIPVTGGQDGQKHKLYFVTDPNGGDLGTAIIISVTFNAK